MPKIIVKKKTETYKEFLIQPIQERISVGAENDNDLVILGKSVSLHHLVVLKQGNQYYIEDLNSESGTTLNKKNVKHKVNLSNGDTITIGDHSLIFENVLFENKRHTEYQDESIKKSFELKTKKNSEPVNSEEKDDSLPSTLNNNTEETPIEKKEKDKSDGSDQTEESFVPHSLLTIHGPYLGNKYLLNPGITKIGRDQTLNDIVIRETINKEVDTSISRRHATILYEDGNFYIRDKRSKTRAWVNQKKLDEDDMIQLSPKDEIQIVSDQMSTIFRFLETGEDDFSRPDKAGFWWDRNAYRMGRFVSFFVAAALIFLIVISFNNIKIIKQIPDVFNLQERILFRSTDNPTVFFNKGEVLKNAAALSPAVADLNGDNFLEIIFLDKTGYLHVMDGKTYLPLWKDNFPHRAQLPVGLTLADINENNSADIIIAAFNSIVYAIDGSSGNEIWASPILGSKFTGNPVVTDLNGDNLLDLFISDLSGKLHIGYGGFCNPDWITVQVDAENISPPSAVDIDNDGLPEIVFGSDEGQVFVYSGSERRITKTIDINLELQKVKSTLIENHSIKQKIAAGKLNDDLFEDIVIQTEQNHILAFDVVNNKCIWFDVLKIETDSGIVLAATVGDLNGNKKMDIAIRTKDNNIIAYDGLGNGIGLKKINWQYFPKNNEQFVSFPVITDINKDNKSDLIVTNYNGGINIFNGTDGNLLIAYKSGISDSIAVIGTPIVADLNNNGWLDILIRKDDASFTILESNSQVKKGAIIWGQFNFNSEQKGCIVPGDDHKILYFSIFIFSVLVLMLLFIINFQVSMKRTKIIKQRV
jgi:pSer/pThr/pTyr-binding forkhead associated (FHA) protein